MHFWGFEGRVKMRDGDGCGRVEGIGMFMWNGDPHDHAIWVLIAALGCEIDGGKSLIGWC